MKLKRYILLLLLVWAGACAYAQTDTIRYVRADGSYTNDGRSWANAKDKVQDAINDLRDYLERNHLTSGSVYIAAGKYVPTESTESSGGSILNTSFKIYAGIHVYGGFDPATPESKPEDRIMANGKKCSENWADQSGIGTTSGQEIVSQWEFRHKTVLSGNHTETAPTFVFDSIRGRYNTAFPASSFHVVWFATNGMFKTGNDSTEGHYRPLLYPASLDGCVISSGSASSKSTTVREHTAYGGGVYMVGNTSMRGCTVERCVATMRGGGIYCDGGGDIDFCYVQTCQATGIGVLEGYGGGVCIDYDGSCNHSHITNCAARCGGGLMITHVSDEYPVTQRLAARILPRDTAEVSHYFPFSSASVINNNTANAEGGGIYLVEGGTINHATVTANNCCGLDVTYYGRRHGRSGGIYVRNCGMIFNSVFWGNRCDVNNDIQFASVRQREVPQAPGDVQQVYVYHSAFMNHDVTDWTGATKESVYTLDKSNMPFKGSYSNHPCFFNPTADPEDWDRFDTVGGKLIMGAGVFLRLKRYVDIPGPRIWHLTSYSALDQKGVQWSEAVQDVSPWLIHAHTDYGVVSNPYEPVSTLGGLVRKPDPITYSLVVPQSLEYRIGDRSPIPTLFVDPNRKGNYDSGGQFIVNTKEGDTWDTPIRDLGEAISYFRQFLVEEGGHHRYRMPDLDGDGMATLTDSTSYAYVQILVKPGELRTIGPGNYVNRNIRTAAIHMEPHIRMYGGYPANLTGTNTQGRNPRTYRSRITCNVTGQEGAAAYANNSAHCVAIVNADSVIVDGFMLEDANTHNVYNGETAAAGGGILVNNATLAPEDRIDMVGNEIRNCVINNCTSPKGAGIFVNGEHPKGDGTPCYAELKLVNTIVRNNTSDYDNSTKEGTIVANGRAYIFMDHCDVLNNAGYAFKSESRNTIDGGPIVCPHPEHGGVTPYHGYIRMDNSIVYCNGPEILTNFMQLDSGTVICMDEASQDRIYGVYNMFDSDLQMRDGGHTERPHGFFQNGYSLDVPDGFVPDGVVSKLTTDVTTFHASDSASRKNECRLTRLNMDDENFPTFQNPSRNIGHTDTGDKPLYGGIIAYVPLNDNPIVNAANREGHTEYDNFDRSDSITRDRGGAPDLGAIENMNLPRAGAVLYVTPDGAGKRDGSSWDNAIAGNTVYQLSGVTGPALAAGDQIDSEPTCDRVLDSEGNPILTTNAKYNGGWGKVWISGKNLKTTATLVTRTSTVDKNVYTGGGTNDRIEYGTPVLDTTSVTEDRSDAPTEFTPQYQYDPRHPYGEISSASRSFWRANPYTGTYGTNQRLAFINDCNTNGWINNTREEKYVSGLQYAVEKASAANKTAHKVDSVQVWVGAGKYTDYKGYIMRDSVTVYGGFPYGKYTAPGMSERHALMSDLINIPKALDAQDFDPKQYETVLQISNVYPITGSGNKTKLDTTNAVKYWDDDYAMNLVSDTVTTQIVEDTITNTYTWSTISRDTSTTYMLYPDLKKGNEPVFHKNFRNKTDVTAPKDTTIGGMPFKSGQNIVYQFFGDQGTGTLSGNKSWELIYANRSGNFNFGTFGFKGSRNVVDGEGESIGTVGQGMELDGCMYGMNVWQTMKNVPAGDYIVQVDLAAYYVSDPSNPNTGITFDIVNSSGAIVSHLSNVYYYSDPIKLQQYSFEFNQPADGDLTIRMMGDTVKTVDNSNVSPAYDKENANRRKVLMADVHLIRKEYKYVYTGTHPDRTIVSTSDPEEVEHTTYTRSVHRTTLRKRVLTMPDVCVPTYGGLASITDPVNATNPFTNDELSHTDRVWGPTKDLRTAATLAKEEDPHYVEYNEANWDGFTIRNGFLYNEAMAHGGGAGVNMYEGAHLRNCIVVNNISACSRIKGGGVFCDGATSTVEGCFVLNNAATQGSSVSQSQVFAGAMFMYEGTCFNSLFANNYSYGSAGGLGFCVGRFYNNTIAYNTCSMSEGGAISLATSSNPNLFVANTIIFGNNGIAIRDRNTDFKNVNPYLHCYVQSATAQPNAATNRNVTNWTAAVKTNYGINNIYLNGVAPSAANTPFAADFVDGVYTPGNAKATNDYRLRSDSCINKGTENFGPVFYQALSQKGWSKSKIEDSFVYKSVKDVNLPPYDVAFAKRVQDCQVDIGAYEFNAAFQIQPDTITHPGRAIYYVQFDSPGGDASSNSPKNAACAQKLQLILDAAGRYKYKLKTKETYNKGATDGKIDPFVSRQPNKYWSVEVWMLGDDYKSTTESNSDSCEHYTPTRSTKSHVLGTHDNTLDYSFIVPHGVQVKGGFADGFYQVMSLTGDTMIRADGTVKTDTAGQAYRFEDLRDPLTYRTVLSGKITSSTGAEGQIFHVVTFTNDLFDENEKLIDEGGQLAELNAEEDRAVLDGLFIMDGSANAPDEVDQIGAGAVVTNYAHIRNCVIQNNTAMLNGGGLYLKPYALVSGCIIKKNKAEVGGGIYVESPAPLNVDSLAHVFTSTVCENTATASAGGMWFDNTYVRVNSSAFWHNEASDNANVSGNFSRSSANTDYPFNFCAVESRRLEGQANIELSPNETEGVRWDVIDPFNAILYYPIEMSSTLSRAGITYTGWDSARVKFPTLDSLDIARVHRAQTTVQTARNFAWAFNPIYDTLVVKNNDFIDIGARAINKNYEITVDQKYVMHRLYVMHTDLINSEAARALQDNTNTDSVSNMYRQMGSCIYNPFHRLGDAFDYIIQARKEDPDEYRNRVFEVFIEAGTYYPYHNAYGEQDEVRNNTFLIPEAIYVIGGINSAAHKYGQEGYHDPFTGKRIGSETGDSLEIPGTGYYIECASLDSIRLKDAVRPMRDNNMNSVIEPWELEHQTVLSGNAVSGDNFTHVYHVITMHADTTHVGPQPKKYFSPNPRYLDHQTDTMFVDTLFHFTYEGVMRDTFINVITDTADFAKECDLSVLGRTTEFDGITITGGYANHLDAADTIAHPYVQKTYFRGGGIFVDGLWTAGMSSTTLPNATDPAPYNIPIVVENCVFTDNMAGNGGGIYSNGDIYMYGCHFTQNYSQGPMTKLDQQFIPWTAGGCVASNARCDISNSLFANNEARRGLYPIAVTGADYIPDADARQGFGGCLSIAGSSRLRAVNCHFMKNKAVAYSAIYNFLANNRYKGDEKGARSDSMQYAFNTIFWGNEVFQMDLKDMEKGPKWTPDDQTILDASQVAFTTKYKGSRAGVFHYDADIWDRYEKLFYEYDTLYHYYVAKEDTFNSVVTDKLKELRQTGDSLEGLYFCSYRKGYGPTGMKPNKDGYLLTKEEHSHFVDPRQIPVKLKPDKGSMRENFDSLFTYLHGNNNTLINRINTATDGPNFKQPSFVAGIDGYMQNADWLVARMNLTTDQGWGHMTQTVSRDTSYYITSFTGTNHFPTREAAAASLDSAGISYTKEDIMPIMGLPAAQFKTGSDQDSLAIYNYYSKRFGAYMSPTNPPLPIGEQQYMVYTRSTSDSEESGVMNRISKNPKAGVSDVYIDVGIYEYQYIQLNIKGREIDTMWVATKTKDPIKHDGLSWETPTTDLQMAIDMLMSSHNDHDKYICLMGDPDGTVAPINVLDNRLTFLISSNSLAPLMPDSAKADTNYGVKSLNFIGGYSFDVVDAPRDPVTNPVVVEMPYSGNKSQLNQLFVVEDMTRLQIQANWQGQSTTRDNVVIPISFDGITFINPYAEQDETIETDEGGLLSKMGGAAIYYRWQRQYDGTEGHYVPHMNMALYADSVEVDGRTVKLPKLTISNCIFMDNGDTAVAKPKRSSAVRIDHGGGSSLIVNSLFHSNAGDPIHAHMDDIPTTGETNLGQVPNNVEIVNSTFALNGGHLSLEADASQIHNSLIWLDDLNNDTTTQLAIGPDSVATKWGRATEEDRSRTGIAGQVTNNAIWGCFQDGDDTYHNETLVTDNTDVFNGPCFINPNPTAATDSARRARNFNLNPSVRTINRADTTLYRSKVFYRVYPGTSDGKYWRRPEGFKDTVIYKIADDYDLGYKTRIHGKGMERGAYECRAVLQRVLYVNPRMSAISGGDGSSWDKAFGSGQLQKAIDAAAVYTYLQKGSIDPETQRSYVYVKGSYESDEQTHIIARDGVNLFGSIPSTFTDEAYLEDDAEYISNAECRRYVNYVRATTPDVGSPDATPTRIHSFKTGTEPLQVGMFVSGFIFSNPGRTLSESPLHLDDPYVIIRNCIFTDNKMESGVPVADVKKGFVYNNLFYGDTADIEVRLGSGGLALNNTVAVTRTGAVPIDVTNAADSAALNNIALWTDTAKCFAPYMTDKNPYALPEFFYNNKSVLAYQLHEKSGYINSGLDTAKLPAVFTKYKLAKVLNVGEDRDVLGNPRIIGGKIDVGALETWYVEPNTTKSLTSWTSGCDLLTREEAIAAAGTEEGRARLYRAFTENNGGHMYPHPGSVVYLMDTAAITMKYDNADEFKDFRSDTIVLKPGYILLKSGASFYGNGHKVQFQYVAAEKRFINQRYSMTAFPFNYSTANITSQSYNAVTGAITNHLAPMAFTTYQYNGAARSAKDYVFQPNNSTLWTPIDTLNRTATDGYLMDFGETITDTVLRFTAFAAEPNKYVYTETDTVKYVYLTQYDKREAGTGSGLNFTRQEDMGWNMKGLPWLVSDYRTDTLLEEDNYLRQMFIPHVLYQMDGAGEYLTEGDKVYSARSWDDQTTVSMANAFLLQTATTGTRERVMFHLPRYTYNDRKGRPLLMISNRKSQDTDGITSDVLTFMPDDDVAKTVNYAYGRDAIKWISSSNSVQVYMLDAKRMTRISLLGAAPTEIDIPLGVFVPNSPSQGQYTFSLPEKEAFDAYEYVWLIDYKLNRYVNLLFEDYEVDLEPGEHNNRFAVRIGGFPKTDAEGKRDYIVFAFDGMLFVRGLVDGDRLVVYAPDGKLIYSGTAMYSEFSMPLFYQTGYVVKVNDKAYKVMNR